jgi:hypothetical protein
LRLPGIGQDWSAVQTVARWLREHPSAAMYVRQVDLPGVDTKVIETHKRTLADLLPGPTTNGPGWFERRYGFRTTPAMVRFRTLDPTPTQTSRGLPHLRPDEQEVYDGLRTDRWGHHVRLKQERIAFDRVRQAVQGIRPARPSPAGGSGVVGGDTARGCCGGHSVGHRAQVSPRAARR